jgi:hypothetical protein
VSCVKLPASVAFPTDDGLLRRIAELRRALPKDSMKPLRNRRVPTNIVAASGHHVLEIESQMSAKPDGAREAHTGVAIDFAAARSDRKALAFKPNRGRPAVSSLASALT